MNKIFTWIEENKFFSIYLLILLFIIPIISISYLNAISKNTFFNNLGISSDGLITYIAGFLAFIGSVVLGAVAVHQNDSSNKINSKLLELEVSSRRPFVAIDNVHIFTCSGEDVFVNGTNYFLQNNYSDFLNSSDAKYINIKFENVGPNYLEFEFKRLTLKTVTNEIEPIIYTGFPQNTRKSVYRLNANENITFNFVVSHDELDKKISHALVIELDTTNIFGELYKEYISLLIVGNDEASLSSHAIRYHFERRIE